MEEDACSKYSGKELAACRKKLETARRILQLVSDREEYEWTGGPRYWGHDTAMPANEIEEKALDILEKDELKLFVWEGVLSDYYSGMVVALAHDEREALDLLKKKDEIDWERLVTNEHEVSGEDYDYNLDKKLKELGTYKLKETPEPKVITEPAAFSVFGGG